jgi:hypothetical protein
MTRTDRIRLLTLCALAAPFFLSACGERDAENAGAASAESPPVIVPELPEVIVTASRLEPEEREDDARSDDEERRVVARRNR